MGLGKPQVHDKFEVAGFIYYRNIRVFVFERQIRILSHPLGVVRDFIYSSLESAYSRLPIRDNRTFLLALTVETL